MMVSKRWQRRLMEGLRVAYCGVEGAFAHIASKRIFPEGTPVSFASFEDAYKAVEDGGFAIRSAANTAVAAQETASAGGKTTAAIASAETAALYGLEVLDHDINESRDNTTRFAVFSRTEDRPTQKQKGGAFLLLFTVKDDAGGLAKAVNIISAYDFNMRVLRSRPMKGLPHSQGRGALYRGGGRPAGRRDDMMAFRMDRGSFQH